MLIGQCANDTGTTLNLKSLLLRGEENSELAKASDF